MDTIKNTKRTGKPVVISYLRFSRPEQLKGDSLRRQLALGDEWARRNGLTISDTFQDKGVSGFRGKNAAQGSLSRLLALIDSGAVPEGSVLLVEQLDRLSRNALLEALELFLSIIRRGIKIVTLMDGQEYDRESLSRNMMQLQYSIMMMSLAHEESAKKSERLAHAWHGKRLKMASKVLTKRLPAWLKVEGDQIVIDDAKAKVVRRAIELVLAGHGLTAVTKKMNAEFDGLARVNYFNRSYISKIANSRSLIGEFQPHRNVFKGGKQTREPVGEPLKDYYPALIDVATWYRLRHQLQSRRSTGGRNSSFVNLFVGLIHDACDGSRMQIIDKGNGRRYASSAAILSRKGASAYVGFPVDAWERGVLFLLVNDILPHMQDGQQRGHLAEIEAMEARVAEVDRRIAQTQELMLSETAVSTASVISMLAKLDQNRKALATQLDALREDAVTNAANQAVDVRRQVETLVGRSNDDGTMSHDDRIELRGVIRSIVSRIDVKVAREGRDYRADIRLQLRDGRELEVIMFAFHVSRMKRNAKGHPIKGGSAGPAVFEIGYGKMTWTAPRH